MTLGPLLLGVAFPLLTVSTVFVGLRLYCRKFIVRSLGIDDWLMFISLLSAWGVGMINIFQVKYGSGTHMKELVKIAMAATDHNELFVGTLKAWYIYQILYLMTLFFIKMSILTFYRRLSPAHGYHLAIKIVAVIVSIYTVTVVFVNAFECPKKPSLAWSPKFPDGCRNLVPIYYAQAGFNILSDIVILLLPLPSLLKLHVSKLALVLVFSIGGFAVVASIVRINALFIYQHSTDIPYDGIYILIWSQVEINSAIISTSAPSIRPLVKSLAKGSTTGRSTYSGNCGGSHSTQYTKNRIPLQSFSGTGKDAKITTNVSGREINESEENIVTGAGIFRTTDVRVEVFGDGRSDVESMR